MTLTCTRGLTGVAEIQALVGFVGWSLHALLDHDIAVVQSCFKMAANCTQFTSLQVQAQSDTSSIAPCLHRSDVKFTNWVLLPMQSLVAALDSCITTRNMQVHAPQ